MAYAVNEEFKKKYFEKGSLGNMTAAEKAFAGIKPAVQQKLPAGIADRNPDYKIANSMAGNDPKGTLDQVKQYGLEYKYNPATGDVNIFDPSRLRTDDNKPSHQINFKWGSEQGVGYGLGGTLTGSKGSKDYTPDWDKFKGIWGMDKDTPTIQAMVDKEVERNAFANKMGQQAQLRQSNNQTGLVRKINSGNIDTDKINERGFMNPANGDNGFFNVQSGQSPNAVNSNTSNKGSYNDKIMNLLDQYANNPDFSFNAETDSSALAMKKMYENQGEKDFQNTTGDFAAMTGGRLNSWATSSAAQARNDSSEKYLSLIPELENKAYGRYKDNKNELLEQLGIYQGLEQTDYNRGRDSIADKRDERNYKRDILESDRGYNRGVLESDRNYDRDVLESDRGYDYQTGRDDVNDANYTDEIVYNRSRDTVADTRYTDETSYNRGQEMTANTGYMNVDNILAGIPENSPLRKIRDYTAELNKMPADDPRRPIYEALRYEKVMKDPELKAKYGDTIKPPSLIQTADSKKTAFDQALDSIENERQGRYTDVQIDNLRADNARQDAAAKQGDKLTYPQTETQNYNNFVNQYGNEDGEDLYNYIIDGKSELKSGTPAYEKAIDYARSKYYNTIIDRWRGKYGDLKKELQDGAYGNKNYYRNVLGMDLFNKLMNQKDEDGGSGIEWKSQ
jgi:hypothetical protein